MTDNIMIRERADVGSYEDIVAAAQRTTGMTDFGSSAHEEGLRVLVEDLASPAAGLPPRGNYFQRSEVKSALVGRLLTQAAFTRYPEHASVPLERTIFVMGLPRTGPTALHRLLHAAPRHVGGRPGLRDDAEGVHRPPRGVAGVHGDPLHGRHLGRGVLAAAAPDRQVDLLRVAGRPPPLLGVAAGPGLGRRVR